MLAVVFEGAFAYILFDLRGCVVGKKWENSTQTEIPKMKGCVSSLLRGEYYETIFNSIDVDYWWCSSG
ncbi:hypothetical protein VCRA2116O30_30047 [Vibrio crassostreae]|nr:hypothetical protein VCRA2119O45_20250 [Vibrio crassostreae]CAK2054358.1 hypothetical protein VCRA2116O26_30088 [Vibrio crassostreae]CAK2055156.1 hypothetical protein VCRA2116O31_30086 [Vibrio crassostreae]CAK2067044.1 hypothetical protein VCRA2116O30_30047 [Vibrio crassostreae]CAK2068671.1 hypothetical protein VCRA2117O39_30065 [Vibrio crassostreae]